MSEHLLSENIKKIRETLKLTRMQVAKGSKISLMAYSNIENGISIPKDETLENIAHVFGVTINKLWQRENYSEQIRFRSNSKLQMRGKILDKCEDYVELLRKLYTNYKKNDFMDLAKDIKKEANTPKEAAIYLRKSWNLGNESLDGLLYLIREKGIELFSYKAITEHFSSFSGIYKNFGPLIVFNSWEMITVEDIIFNIVHELGHIILHSYSETIFDDINDNKQDEEADEFASNFLMPDDALEYSWNLYQDLPLLERVFAIKSKYKIGWANAAKRLSTLKNTNYLIKIESILQNLSFNLRVNKEPYPLERDVLFKDGCKESFIPKIIISNINNNIIQKKTIEKFFSKKDLDNSLNKFKTWENSILTNNDSKLEIIKKNKF